jgi:hypothetical protein
MSDVCIVVTKKEIIELLKTAFNEGWDGYYDLRDSVVEKLIDDFLEERKKKSRSMSEIRLQENPSAILPEQHFEECAETITYVSSVPQSLSGTVVWSGLPIVSE